MQKPAARIGTGRTTKSRRLSAIFQRALTRICRPRLSAWALAGLVLGACEAETPRARSEAPSPAAEGRVASVPDGQTLILDSGLEVRLAFLRAPSAVQGGAPAEPGQSAARDLLADLALDRVAALSPPASSAWRDRHGRLIAAARIPGLTDETLLQSRLVEAGLARVDPEVRDEAGGDDMAAEAMLARLLALEAWARMAERGIWSEPYFAVRDADAASASAGAFQIVEGRLVDSAQVRGVTYLNFGPDYRSDFTGVIAREAADRFDIERLLAAPGARLRLRGLVVSRNGPMIALTRPAQIEWLSDESDGDAPDGEASRAGP